MVIDFQAALNAPQTSGTVFLVALASDSGEEIRGRLRLDYLLGDAIPVLYAAPTYLELGVQQNASVSGNISLGNRGLAAATGVTANLTNAPDWLFLASTSALGTLGVGQKQLVQIVASPGSSVSDGVYTAQLEVAATNTSGGTVPISVYVTQEGEGSIRFHAADIFTETLDDQGQPILGVAGARITLQNEAVTSLQRTLTTDSEGVALVENVPPGNYRYRASASNHVDTSGRLQVQPGVTLSQNLFLDYSVISVTFSVTETTISDHYDLVLTATYQTQVPAPVVVMEPLSVNLPDLQVGESFTGELTISNYGLVRADDLSFNPPESDEFYQYEWLGEVPESLAAKTRISVPYRITARALHPQSVQSVESGDLLMGSPEDDRYARQLSEVFAQPFASGDCSSYSTVVSLGYAFTCANGDERNGGASTLFSRLRGTTCTSDPQAYQPPSPLKCTTTPCHDVGGFGGPGGGGSPAAIPLTGGCTPDCNPTTTCCSSGGTGPGGPGPGPGPGPGGGPGPSFPGGPPSWSGGSAAAP